MDSIGPRENRQLLMDFIPYGRQDITAEDVAAVTEALNSDWLTQGPAVPRFESAVVAYCGVGHAVAVNSATSALHIACLALGLRNGDWLWTSPNTFVASANCGLYCGAQVDFVDIDPRTLNMSATALAKKLAAAKVAGKLPKIVVPVHFSGQSCDMDVIAELAREYGFRLIEDASHAIGGRYRGLPVGSCRYSDITVFSFHPVKIVTTAEGGMAVTNDAALAERMKMLRTHGITREPSEMAGRSQGPWYYEQVALGFNYRMTDILAALGCSQINRLDAYVARRHEIAGIYDDAFRLLPVVTPSHQPSAHSAMHLYVVRLRLDEISVDRSEVFLSMRAKGIGVNVHYVPVHLQPYYARMGFRPNAFPEAERYYAEAISLPMFPALTREQQGAVIRALRESLAHVPA
jgi:UDP-4-amino-4,6-dideoxy-N-acetyl-beta-L-altrosamine transaminase